MSTTQQPPVNEVVLSIAIAQQDALSGPRLSEVLGDWFREFPDVQTVPPYEMPPETPLPHPGPKSGIAAFELVTGVPMLRYWLTSANEPYLIQVQPDYLALNWRRRDARSEYVHYEAIRERFSAFLRTVADALGDRGGALLPTRAELTYVNVIEPNALWRRSSEAHNLFAIEFSDADDYEQLSLGYTKAVRSGGEWRGRLRVTLQGGHDLLKDEPRLLLNLTARSGSLTEPTEAAALGFLDESHEAINRTFLALLKPEARELWGLSDRFS